VSGGVIEPDVKWDLRYNHDGCTAPLDRIQATLLMDIRRELKTLNDVLRCGSFQRIPYHLNRIAANTAKPKKKRKVAP
jgi:hypothetical protein